MDADRFDALVRSLIALRTRRGTLGAALGGVLGLLGLTETAADPHQNRRRHAHHREVEAQTKRKKRKKGKKGKRKTAPPPCAETCAGCCDDGGCQSGTDTTARGARGTPCLDCATIGTGQTCGGGPGGGTPGVCGCTPTTCLAQGKDCGTAPDGCGEELNCGACPLAGQPCVANVCGACVEDCAGKACGADHACGGTCAHGSCPAGQTCGGGGTPNVCGNCTIDDDCDDGITCTVDVCVAGVCTNTPDHGFCRGTNINTDCAGTSGSGCVCRCGGCGEGICCNCCFFFPFPDPRCVF